MRVAALEALSDSLLQLGEHDEAAGLLEAHAHDHPTRERLQYLLALSLYRADRQDEALRVIDRCRRSLLNQSGLSLGSELRTLEVSILEQSPLLAWRRPDDPSIVVPDGEATPTTLSKLSTHSNLHVAAETDTSADTRTAVVGRTGELSALEAVISAAETGVGTMVMILGEPGIGKTRLAEAAVERAAERGMLTAWARCPEDRSAPSFWPLVQLGEQLRAAGFSDLRVGELDRRVAESAVSERFELHRAVLEAVRSIGRPALLVIDDLQWADPDTLRLLEHIGPELRSTGTLLIATSRPIDDAAPSALVDCLAEVSRVPHSVQMVVGGLDPDAIAAWLGARHDVVNVREIAELVHARTGGNALFVREVIELLASEGRLIEVESVRHTRAIPPGVKSVVRRRVSRLPAPTQAILPVAAVLGRSLDIVALAGAAGSDTATLLEALEPAVEAGVLVESSGGLLFSHMIVADALADEVNALRRAAIHAAASLALTDVAGAGFGMHAAKIASHAFEGIMAGTGELAIAAGTRAAELASAQLAHEDAAAHWSRVADAVARCRPSDLHARIDALNAQARALLRADMVVAAKSPIVSAIELAATAGLPEDMANAALLVNHEHVWANEPYGVVDTVLVRALERTIGDVADTDPQRPLLLGALAAELAFDDPDRHAAACESAERAARRHALPSTLASVLNAVTVPCRPGQLDQRARWAREVIELSMQHELAVDQRFAAHYHLTETFVERSEFARADAELATARRLIEAVPSDRLHSQLLGFESALSLARGRHRDAERRMVKSQELHRRGRRYDSESLMLANDLALAMDVGGLEELIPFAVSTAGESPYGRAVSEVVAFAMLEIGRTDIASELVDAFDVSSGFADDYMAVCCMTAAVHVRVSLDDRPAADAFARRLAPFSGRWAGAGTTPLSMGPADLALARALAISGNVTDASATFDRCVKQLETNEAYPWLARALVRQAQFLNETGDAAAADAAADRAAALADRFALVYVSQQLAELVR